MPQIECHFLLLYIPLTSYVIVKYPSQWIRPPCDMVFVTRETLQTGSVGVQKNVQSECNCTVGCPVPLVCAVNWYANGSVGGCNSLCSQSVIRSECRFLQIRVSYVSVLFLTSSLLLNLRTNNTVCIGGRDTQRDWTWTRHTVADDRIHACLDSRTKWWHWGFYVWMTKIRKIVSRMKLTSHPKWMWIIMPVN
jgi:hypothetical protein